MTKNKKIRSLVQCQNIGCDKDFFECCGKQHQERVVEKDEPEMAIATIEEDIVIHGLAYRNKLT